MREAKIRIYCDACGEEIKRIDYCGSIQIAVELFSENKNIRAVLPDDGRIDFCKDCMIDFGKWRRQRRTQYELKMEEKRCRRN